MKPKTKIQQQVLELSKRLPKITKVQERWAFKHCFDHVGKRYANGKVVCLECGHEWIDDNSYLADALLGCECPNCNTPLTMKATKQRVFKQREYFGIVTTCGGSQVIRYFQVEARQKVGEKACYTCTEVVQRWLSPIGKEVILSRSRGMSMVYYDFWVLGSPLEIRHHHRSHDINPVQFYPKKRVIAEVSRNGFSGNYHGIHPLALFRSILTSSKAETLLKAGQHELLKHFVRGSMETIDTYWNSIRIAIRNGYIIKDGSIWCDYIDQLNFFGKDTNSPKYVCPDNLYKQHDLYMKKKRAERERQELERSRQKAQEHEAEYKELKGNFFGITFTDGTIQVRVLESVDEFMAEGRAMHHCVANNAYYLKENSLILSATIDGKRIETIEISLKTLNVMQSRGVCNKNTEYHDQIIQLVNKNINLIRSRMTA